MLNSASQSKLCLLVITFAGFLLLSPAVCAKDGVVKSQLNSQLLDEIAKIRNGETSTARTDAAERLAMLTRGINPHRVDDTTLAEMVSLLDTKEDSVRAWVAGALGNLGRRAKVAVPKLLELLPEVDCLRGSLTSAPVIRIALKRLGKRPPPRPDCRARNEQE